MSEPVRLDRYRERVEVEGRVDGIIGRGLKPVYVIAEDKNQAISWAHRNKPGFAPKFCSSRSIIPPRGLHLPDVPVYVLSVMLPEVREAWQRTRANLVYL